MCCSFFMYLLLFGLLVLFAIASPIGFVVCLAVVLLFKFFER